MEMYMRRTAHDRQRATAKRGRVVVIAAAVARGILAPLSVLMVASTVILAAPADEPEGADAVSSTPTPVCVGATCTVSFPYTGDFYTWTAPYAAEFTLEAWGAQGGNDPQSSSIVGGRGGYAKGVLSLSAGDTLHVYVGGQGTGCTSSRWWSTGGGGATDFRLVSGSWNSSAGLNSRILVAGGGGGRHGKNYENSNALGNDGGGTSAPTFTAGGYTITGANQTSGGSSPYPTGVSVGSFGFANPGTGGTNTCSAGGWNGGSRGSDEWANGGGGGGWWGGVTSWPTGSGGSGYVLTSSSTKPGGYTPTSAHWMTGTVLTAGNALMPDPVGTTMMGRSGHGIARISYINGPTVSSFTSSHAANTNTTGSITYSLTMGASVTGMDNGDFENAGTASGCAFVVSGSGANYTVTVSSCGEGTLTPRLKANSVFLNVNGPANAVSASTTITIDRTNPGASISTTPSSPAAAMSLTFGVSFTESVSGIASGDFSNGGSAQGCVFTPSASSGSSVNVVVTQCEEGTLQLVVAASGVTDAAGNLGPVSAVSSSTITLAASALSVTAGDKTANYGGSWTDSYTQTGLINPDTITVSYSYSGTTNEGVSYGPSASKPTEGGTYSIIPSVSYGAGNTNRYSLARNNGTLTISRAAQSVLTVTSTSATYGQSLSLTTTGGSGNGAVTWAKVSGTCSVSGSTLTPGDAGSSCVVRATKAQDGNYLERSSVDTTVTVSRTAQATLVVASTTATYGETLSLTTTGGSGDGNVTWAKVSGTCSVSGSTLTPGDAGSSCVVRATKAQDTNYLVVSSADTAITIERAVQAALVVSSTSATYGQTLWLTTTGGSGNGAVTWAKVSGTCSVSGSTLTPGDAGSACVVRATKAQDTNYLVVNSSDTTVVIGRAAQATLTVSSTSATYGQTLSLTTTGGSGNGAVTWAKVSGTCSVSGSTLTPGDAGSACVVRATKAQDTNYLVVDSVDTTVSVARASQANLVVSSTSATYGQTLSLTTTGGSGNGAVTWVKVSGTCSVTGDELTPGDAGSACVVRATKAQDTNYLYEQSSNTTIAIGKANQTGFTITSNTAFTTGSALSLTASGGQSGGAVTWSLNSGACTLAGSTLTASRGGITCVVEATRAGSTNYFAVSETETITVNKIIQVLTFRSTPPASPIVGGTYTVSVDSDASLAVTVAVANTSSSVCSISAGVVSFTGVGSCVISASQAGNDVYAAAAASQSIAVTAAPAPTTIPPATDQGQAASSQTTSPPTTTPIVSVTSTTIPRQAAPSTTTTTTTTTTVPSFGAGQVGLEAGETTALVKGRKVKVDISNDDGNLVVKLPNNVMVKVGPPKGSSSSARINADGVLAAYARDEVAVSAEGFIPGTTYRVMMYSTPVELSRGEVSATGDVTDVVVIPDESESGDHTLVIEGVGEGDEVVAVSLGFTVLERSDNTWAAVTAITVAMLLALLGGRPVWRRRRNRATAV